VAAVRRRDNATPLILMGYGETLRSHGLERFAADAAHAGADAMLFISSTPEELRALDAAAARHGLALIRVAFGEVEDKWREAVDGARGFIYVPAAKGGTGSAVPTPEIVAPRIAQIRALTALPIVAGFGVRTPEMFAALSPYADALAVGSVFAQAIEAGLGADGRARPSLAEDLCNIARRLAASGRR
jgi:tryptophan synthase alpha chain